eukprot:scaffold24952_cov66-Phaeocystis_antarctica.AAC.3
MVIGSGCASASSSAACCDCGEEEEPEEERAHRSEQRDAPGPQALAGAAAARGVDAHRRPRVARLGLASLGSLSGLGGLARCGQRAAKLAINGLTLLAALLPAILHVELHRCLVGQRRRLQRVRAGAHCDARGVGCRVVNERVRQAIAQGDGTSHGAGRGAAKIRAGGGGRLPLGRMYIARLGLAVERQDVGASGQPGARRRVVHVTLHEEAEEVERAPRQHRQPCGPALRALLAPLRALVLGPGVDVPQQDGAPDDGRAEQDEHGRRLPDGAVAARLGEAAHLDLAARLHVGVYAAREARAAQPLEQPVRATAACRDDTATAAATTQHARALLCDGERGERRETTVAATTAAAAGATAASVGVYDLGVFADVPEEERRHDEVQQHGERQEELRHEHDEAAVRRRRRREAVQEVPPIDPVRHPHVRGEERVEDGDGEGELQREHQELVGELHAHGERDVGGHDPHLVHARLRERAAREDVTLQQHLGLETVDEEVDEDQVAD